MNLLKSKVFFIACLILQIGLCSSKNDLPSPTNFLAWLFNNTVSELTKTVNNFRFTSNQPYDVQLLLFPKTGRLLNSDSYIDITNNTLNLTRPTKIIIHGWQANGTSDFIVQMANKYHQYYNYTVISVDWSQHSMRNYITSASSTKDVGYILCQYILKSIGNNTNLLKNLHLIGHSLGAHVSGFTGQYVSRATGGKIARITGLDAASPLFEFPIPQPEDERLSKSDATFVDVIHTDIGFLGVSSPLGDVDFYVDFGGPIQPGCLNLLNIFESLACSHSRAHMYFSATINGTRYEVLPCPKPVETLLCKQTGNITMGEYVPRSAAGIYLVNSEPSSQIKAK